MSSFIKNSVCFAVLMAMCGPAFAATSQPLALTVQYTKTAKFEVKKAGAVLVTDTLRLAENPRSGLISGTLSLTIDSNVGGAKAKIATAPADTKISNGSSVDIPIDVYFAGTKLDNVGRTTVVSATDGMLAAHAVNLEVRSRTSVGALAAGNYFGTVNVTFESEF
ncbi:CS1 type fimbrial major subunit [Chromobacterium amazonense]|uniref:CS1 type fimbrial major subunit n=1 Tax=Chromobacterium amazonense TaxID=1382803 RepID=UPI00237E1572|nr:CS1 type fimbrial major subunit [Chromobacterium amazonense]MDE1715903.1 CS1 type fimbrial major subunit [Chromobacterium amazonense]